MTSGITEEVVAVNSKLPAYGVMASQYAPKRRLVNCAGAMKKMQAQHVSVG